MSVPARVYGNGNVYQRLEELSYVGICKASWIRDPGNQCVILVVKVLPLLAEMLRCAIVGGNVYMI